MKKNEVWVVTGKSESSDDYGPFVFKTKPSAAKLKELIWEEMDGGDDGDGPGSYGSYTYINVEKCEIRD